ncbi:HEAT repeat domain-containing protein [Neobacillus sp. LXY-4]|uniref:HEAT repeat domain-containing protein n=1 Tax=Neobacillus sp. LXY-4 TaxID=3379826 RepID=UPI003EE1CE35
MFQNEIFILSIASSLILSILILLLLYLVIRKAIENSRRRKIEATKEKMNPLLYDYLVDGNVVRGFHADTAIKKMALEELLLRYAEMIEGDEERQNITKLADLYLKELYCRNLKSFVWSKRMNALYHIEDLRLESLTHEVLKRVESKRASTEEVILSFRILADFNYPNMFELLQSKWEGLTEYDFRSILSRLSEPLLQSFIAQFQHCPEQLKYALLEVMSVKRDSNFCFFLETTFLRGEGEIRLRALKAIASIGHCLDVKPYMSLVRSNVWQERMMAAKIFGNMRGNDLIPYLKQLLSDKVWWVRYQAGQSIMMFPDGKEILRTIRETSDDPFAKDMAFEWINKGAV